MDLKKTLEKIHSNLVKRLIKEGLSPADAADLAQKILKKNNGRRKRNVSKDHS